VTGEAGYPAAVLIRGTHDITGPGRLTRDLGITKELNGRKLSKAAGLWIEEGITVPKNNIEKTPRIGVDYAEEWAQKPYRFVWKMHA